MLNDLKEGAKSQSHIPSLQMNAPMFGSLRLGEDEVDVEE
jgi:hypothetical protein